MRRIHVSQDEIIEAVRHYGSCSFDRLRSAVECELIPHRGKTSVVYRTLGRMDGTWEYGAAKIYQDDDTGRKRHYESIIPRLKELDSSCLLPVQYYGKDFLMFGKDGEPLRLPVLAMAWAGGGCTIDAFVRRHLCERTALEALLYQFAGLCIELGKQPFTHGNLRADNIMYQRHAPLALVDYDTLSLKGQATYNPSADDCQMAAIGLSLCLVCADPELWEKYYKPADGLLLFSKAECRKRNGDLPQLDEIQRLKADYPLLEWYGRLFRMTMREREINEFGMAAFSATPERLFTDGNTGPAFGDSFFTDIRFPRRDGNVIYSYDKAYLLSGTDCIFPEYEIKEGTLVICDEAFAYSQVRKVTFPRSVEHIGRAVFRDSRIEEVVCYSPRFLVDNGAVYNQDKTKLICCFTHEHEFIVPASVKEIAAGAFYSNEDIERVVLPDGLEVIPDATFKECGNLRELTVPDSVVEIGDEAFYESGSLASIKLTNVTKFGQSCFERSGLECVRIADGTETLSGNAFLACPNLAEVHLPDTLKIIGEATFSNCWNLKSIVLPDGLEEIKSSAFYHSTSLEKVVFPRQMPIIGDYAFDDTAVENPACRHEDKTQEDGPEWEYNADKTVLVRCRSKADYLVIDDTVRIIGSHAMAGLPVRHIRLPSSLRCVRKDAFAGCKNLETIHLPEGVVSIEDSAFFQCQALRRIETPASLLRLGDLAFDDCSSLRSAVIRGKLSTIGMYTFRDCCLLEKVILPRSLEKIVSNNTFKRCFSLRSVRLPLHAKMRLYIFPDGCKLSFYSSPKDGSQGYELTNLSKSFLGSHEDIWILSPRKGHPFATDITPYVVIEGYKGNLHVSISQRPVYLNRKTSQPSLGMGEKGITRIMDWVKAHCRELLDVWNGMETVAVFRRHLNPEREKERLRKKTIYEFPKYNVDDFA